MKTFFLVAITIFSLVSCDNRKKNDLQKEHLQGKVKSVRTTDYEASEKFGKVVKGNRINNVIDDTSNNTLRIFDEKGNQIERSFYNADSLFWKDVYIYDKKGNLIEENRYNLDGSLLSKVIYTYDKKGNVIEENVNKEYLIKYTYTYDEKGNWIQMIEYENNKPTKITERKIEYYP